MKYRIVYDTAENLYFIEKRIFFFWIKQPLGWHYMPYRGYFKPLYSTWYKEDVKEVLENIIKNGKIKKPQRFYVQEITNV